MSSSVLYQSNWVRLLVLVLLTATLVGCGLGGNSRSRGNVERAMAGIVEAEWNRLPATGSLSVVVDSSEVTQHPDSPFLNRIGREIVIEYSVTSRTALDIAMRDGDETYFTMASDGRAARINDALYPSTEALLMNEKEVYRLQPFYIVMMHLFPLSDGLIVPPQGMPAILALISSIQENTATGKTMVDLRYLTNQKNTIELGAHPRLWASTLDGHEDVHSLVFSDPQDGQPGVVPFKTLTGNVAGMHFVSKTVP